MKQTLDVALVDDQISVRVQIEREFQKYPGRYRLSSYFPTVDAAKRELPALKPDVVLVDMLFPEGVSGLECVWHIAPLLPKAGIIMLTVSHSPGRIFQALRAGADAYVLKHDFDKLIHAVENVHRGFAELSPSVARLLIDHFRREVENPSILSVLTEREADVLRAAASGCDNKTIATDFEISCSTVQTHLRNVYLKLRVRSRNEAIQKFRS